MIPFSFRVTMDDFSGCFSEEIPFYCVLLELKGSKMVELLFWWEEVFIVIPCWARATSERTEKLF